MKKHFSDYKTLCLIHLTAIILLLTNSSFAIEKLSILKWSFDDISNSLVKDESGNGNDGTIQGDPQPVPGRIGTALFFDGVDDWIEKINPQNLPCTGSQNWSMNFWVMVDAFPKTDQWLAGWGQQLLGRWINYNDSEKIEKFGRLLYFWPNTQDQVSIGEQIFSFNIWQMITVTYDGQILKVYNNARLEDQRKLKLTDIKGETLAIAKNMSPSEKSGYFKGKIDEFEIYDYALSEEQINYLANPDSAAMPYPADKQMAVETKAALKWKKGINGKKAEVYFGDNYDKVYIANVYDNNCYKGTIDTAILELPELKKGKTYFWRIDQVNDTKTTKGKVWSFTTKLQNNAFIVKYNKQKVKKHEPIFADIYVSDKEFTNPFDIDQVYFDALIKCPDGKEVIAPCFYSAGSCADTMWSLRFTPRQAGQYSCEIKAYVDGKLWKTSEKTNFIVNQGKADGFLSINPDSYYTLIFDSGKLFRGVGTNCGWENFEYGKVYTDPWMFQRLNSMGCNFICTSSMPWHIPLEWNKYGAGIYDLDAADQMDELIALAKANGIYIKLSMHYYWECSTIPDTFGNKMWDQNPYNVINGGPCQTPGDFFTSEKAKKIYKNKLRYQVARWSYSPYLCAWELWKEVDNVERNEVTVTNDMLVSWHREIAQYLKSIDPYDHLITTSRDDFGGKLWDSKDIDFSQSHNYGPTFWFAHVFDTFEKKYNKPHVIGECGYSWEGPRLHPFPKDYEKTFHMSLWRGMFLPTPILPLNWWWQWLDNRNEFYHLGPVAKFSSEMLKTNNQLEKKTVEFKTSRGWDETEVMALKAGPDVFAWMRNPAHYTLKNLTLTVKDISDGSYKVKYFNTKTGKYYNTQQVNVTGGQLKTNIDYLLPDQDVACVIRLIKK